ncbi:MAG: nucleotide exchange factor GrpE [Bacteroidales bacterium]|nr:nucleotide exchange factor GrpE [Bacteroidales bacterium]
MNEEEVKDPALDNEMPETEMSEKEEQTDNTTVTEPENEEKKKEGKSFFSKKNNKEKQKIEELESQVEKLQAEKAELNDRFLRLYSEFDNYKKRVNKEKLDLISTASEKVIVSLLPIMDDFERAIAANEKVEDVAAIKEGFNLIYNKMQQMLTRHNVKEIEAIGQEFDTDLHEAVTHFPVEKEEDKGKVIDVTEKGYKLSDKVIRYAKVVVGQ